MSLIEFWTQAGETLTQIVTFVIFFWLLKKFAWGPLLAVLHERQQRIEEGFADIKRQQAAAAAVEAQYQERLRNIEQEARARIQEAIAEGRRVAAELTEQARVEAGQITDRAQRNIAIEVAKARQELKGEIVNLTIEASERLMRKQLDGDEQRRLVGTFIEELERQSAS